VPCYLLSGRRVWGATAMILAELAAAIGGLSPPEPPVLISRVEGGPEHEIDYGLTREKVKARAALPSGQDRATIQP
ncbi:MAG TPA: hypothetical protein VLH39_03915, partial [Magnetospirillaceae bacterium]|nr:hypothetical protein [Magnetospirillaceae bacterium]